jgi:MOSC domain-containing protein YiiM
MVTEPRMPCYKLGIKFRRLDMVKKFLASQRTGFYFAVLQEGEVGAGDSIERIEENQHAVKVSDITRLYSRDKDNVALLRRAITVEALPNSWKDYFQRRLEKRARCGDRRHCSVYCINRVTARRHESRVAAWSL